MLSPHEFLEERIHELQSNANSYRIQYGIASGTGLLAGAVTLFSAMPVAFAVAPIVLGAYAATLAIDHHTTGHACPLPVLRFGLGECISFFDQAGEAQTSFHPKVAKLIKLGVVLESEAIENLSTIRSLSPDEACEFLILLQHSDAIATQLERASVDQREVAYKKCLRHLQLGLPVGLSVAVEPTDAPRQEREIDYVDISTLAKRLKELSASPEPKKEEPRFVQEVVTMQQPAKDWNWDAPVHTVQQPNTTDIHELLDRMADSGLPIKQLVFNPLIMFAGPSQSGKSTLAHLLNTVRLAMGLEVIYTSADEDYPESIPYSAIAGKQELSTAYAKIESRISCAAKGSLEGTSFTFDELWKVKETLGIPTERILNVILQKLNKTKAMASLITQSDTLASIGGKGIKEALSRTAAWVEPIQERDEFGRAYPSGRYKVTIDGQVQTWAMPDWLLQEVNQYGEPCPSTTLIKLLGDMPKKTVSTVSTVSTFSEDDDFDPVSTEISTVSTRNTRNPETKLETVSTQPEMISTVPEKVSTAVSSHWKISPNPQEDPEIWLTCIRTIEMMHNAGRNQTAVIKAVWGREPNDTIGYKQARQLYQTIIRSKQEQNGSKQLQSVPDRSNMLQIGA